MTLQRYAYYVDQAFGIVAQLLAMYECEELDLPGEHVARMSDWISLVKLDRNRIEGTRRPDPAGHNAGSDNE
jgi:hypothetical protein